MGKHPQLEENADKVFEAFNAAQFLLAEKRTSLSV
jgi:hypothetical protein